MTYTNFSNYIVSVLQKTHSQFYSSYEELTDHILSGEVTIPITYAIQLQKDFEKQLNKLVESDKMLTFIQCLEQEVLANWKDTFEKDC